MEKTHKRRISGWKDNMLELLTPRRIRAISVIWIVIAFIAYFLYLARQTSVGLSDPEGYPLGNDFINYWSAAKLAVTGRIADVYSWARFHEFEQSVVGAPIKYFHYSYPPILPLLTSPLACFPFVVALFVWLAGTWGAFYGALRLTKPATYGLLLSLATPAVFFNAIVGQNGMLTAALMGGGLALLPTSPLAAGALFGLLSFKPQLGVLIPIALIAGRHWRAFGAAGLTVLALVLLSLVFFGADSWSLYFQNANSLRVNVLEQNEVGGWHKFVSVFIVARQLGFSVFWAYVIQGIIGIGAAGMVIRLWRSTGSYDVQCAALVLCTLFATPYVQDYDLVVTAFVVVWLSRAYVNAKLAIVLLLLIPVLSTPSGRLAGVSLGPLMLMPAIGLIWRSCREKRRTIQEIN